jgi:hypothetical protein
MNKTKYLWLLLIIPLLLIALISVSNNRENRQTLQTILVDDFDTIDDWTVKFSRFRSPYFDIEDTLDFEASDPNQPGSYPSFTFNARVKWEPNYDGWYRWIPGGEGNRLLPDGLPERAQRVAEESGVEQKVLGVRSNFDFRGYNWIVIEPANTRSVREVLEPRNTSAEGSNLIGKDSRPGDMRKLIGPYYIQLMGKTQALDFWIWGANYNYELEIHLEDYNGITHILPAGNLKFFGWRNLRVNIPNYISQEQQYTPSVQPLKFIRFKIIANPDERPDNFHIYFDYMQAMTDLYQETYFGRELDDPSIWSGETASTPNPPTPEN